jgi:hypothetical protein
MARLVSVVLGQRAEGGVTVIVFFSDATPVFQCGEDGKRYFGDSVHDAFTAWWKHVGEEHPEIAE